MSYVIMKLLSKIKNLTNQVLYFLILDLFSLALELKAFFTEMIADAVKESLLISSASAALLNVVNATQQRAVVKVVIKSMPAVVFLRHIVI